MRKIKRKKNFEPPLSEEGDEFYPNGIFVFNISKMIQHLDKNPRVFRPEEISVDELKTFRSTRLDEFTVENANLSVPIIMAEISPSQFNIIDGHHRLEKAFREQRDVIWAYKLFAEQHIHFLASTEAYLEYIEYWNNKQKVLEKYDAIRCREI